MVNTSSTKFESFSHPFDFSCANTYIYIHIYVCVYGSIHTCFSRRRFDKGIQGLLSEYSTSRMTLSKRSGLSPCRRFHKMPIYGLVYLTYSLGPLR